MSVSLVIRWPDDRFEDIALGSHTAIRARWEPIARSLGLPEAGQMSQGILVHPEVISSLVAEFQALKRGMEQNATEWAFEIGRVGDLIDGLQRLEASEGWYASID